MVVSNSPAVSLVIPVYNEVDNIAPLHAAINAALEGRHYEIVLVNDGSTDGSKEAPSSESDASASAFTTRVPPPCT